MRLVAVSNRVESPRGAPMAGGLAVALVEALRDHRGLWLGWSGRTGPGARAQARLEAADGFAVATVDFERGDFDDYYNGFANHCLWPLLHFRADIAEFVRAEFDAYERINAAFADALTPLLEPGDLIWIHDYHLFLLPALLRRRGVRQPIGFFLHTPFPPHDIFATLPSHERILRSLFECDLLGLQTLPDVARFTTCVERVAGARADAGRVRAFGRALRVDAFPVGIDAQRFHELAFSAAGTREFRRMREVLRGRDQIIGVDRLDYSKGLLRRMHAFEQMLEQHPDTRGRVDFLQIAPLSRAEVKAYRDFRLELEQKAARINGRFAHVDWTPVRYLNRTLPRKTLAGFYRASRVGLVTPMRDGMNLVAKEYVAAQDAADPGVLVLSQFAGAAQQMREALLVNPYDAGEVAEALYRARAMSLDERRRRHEALMQGLLSDDITSWRRRFLERLSGGRSRASVAA